MRGLNPSTGEPPVTAIGALLLVQGLFGLHYYAAKLVLVEIPPLAWATLRVTAAAALMLPLALVRPGAGALPGRADLGRLAGLSLLGVIINQVCFVAGLARTTPTHSSLINCSIPVLTLLLALALGRERLSPLKAASILVSLGGVLTLLRVDHLVWDRMTQGDLITLVNASSFSLFLVLSRPVLRRLDPFVATGVLFFWGAVGLLPLGLPHVLRIEWGTVPAATWAWAAYIVVGATVLAYGLNSFALQRVESSTVALFIFLQPLLAATLDIWLLGAQPTPRLGVSAATIFLGVYLSIRAGRRRAVTPLPRGG